MKKSKEVNDGGCCGGRRRCSETEGATRMAAILGVSVTGVGDTVDGGGPDGGVADSTGGVADSTGGVADSTGGVADSTSEVEGKFIHIFAYITLHEMLLGTQGVGYINTIEKLTKAVLML
jgi:hypothetical protein